MLNGADEVVVGIDAGGSGTRARAVSGGRVLHDGTGGPGNPLATTDAALRANYAAALLGCPAASLVTACVAGTGGKEQRTRVRDLLAELVPTAAVTVLPDYAAAISAAPDGSDLVVIAGTGSLVASLDPDGTYLASGGRGWILGDHGSASRLGRAALDWYCEDQDAAPAEFAAGVERVFGSRDWRLVVRSVGSAASPAALLARAAPLLTEAAAEGASWAVARLEAEMDGLATTTARHVRRYLPGARREVCVGLSGGVWASEAARLAFGSALARRAGGPVSVTRSVLSPLDGAVRLASGMRA